MESSILKSRAALALNKILATDNIDYRSFERYRIIAHRLVGVLCGDV